MKKLILLISVVAVAFALQAGDASCPKAKAACAGAQAAGCSKAQAASCCKAQAAGCAQAQAGCSAKGGCPASVAKDTTKKPLRSPKDAVKS